MSFCAWPDGMWACDSQKIITIYFWTKNLKLSPKDLKYSVYFYEMKKMYTLTE